MTLQPAPTTIIARRVVEEPGGCKVQVLVDWDGLPCDDTTWVDWENLVRMFPEVDHEGMVIVEKGVIDVT